MTNILITTTPTVENRPVREYLGIVSGEAFTRWCWSLDYYASMHGTEALDNFDFDIFHSVPIPSSIPQHLALAYPTAKNWANFKAELHKARDWAIQQMAKAAEGLGANAVIGVKIDYKTPGDFSGYYDRSEGSFSMYAESVWVIATGTAVRL